MFTSEVHRDTLQRFLDRLPSLAERRNDFKEPAPDPEPRPHLQRPKKDWDWEISDSATENERISDLHERHEPLCNTHREPTVATSKIRLVQIKNVSDTTSRVTGDVLTAKAITEDAKPDLPSDICKDYADNSGDNENSQLRTFHFWDECRAIICLACDSRPLLSRQSVIHHIQEQHASEEQFQDPEAFEKWIAKLTGLAEELADIRLPIRFI
jgi:hypothetical protein